MGFFDRFAAKKPEPSASVSPAGEPAQLSGAPHPGTVAGERREESAVTTSASAAGVKPRLSAARERIATKDLPGAMVIYEELLATSGDRADVLVAISGDLGS